MENVLRDRRAHRRYPLHLPVRYNTLKGGFRVASGVGLTENLSSEGIAFAAEIAIDIGSAIEIWVSWPAAASERPRLELQMTGRVVRSAGGETAVHVRRHDFVSAKAARSQDAASGTAI